MSTGGDTWAVGTTHWIDKQLWVVTAHYPIRVTTSSDSATGGK